MPHNPKHSALALDTNNDLRMFLIHICPEDEFGNHHIGRLSSLLGYGNATLYRWLGRGNMSMEGALRLVELSKQHGGDLELQHMHRFLFAGAAKTVAARDKAKRKKARTRKRGVS